MLMILSFGASHVPGIGGLEIETTTLWVHNRLHIYPLCGIFSFPWHRHQVEGTNGFLVSLPKDTSKVGWTNLPRFWNGSRWSLRPKSPTLCHRWFWSPVPSTESPTLYHSTTAPHCKDSSWMEPTLCQWVSSSGSITYPAAPIGIANRLYAHSPHCRL